MDEERNETVRATLEEDTLPTLEELMGDLRDSVGSGEPGARDALAALALIGAAARHNASAIARMAGLEDALLDIYTEIEEELGRQGEDQPEP